MSLQRTIWKPVRVDGVNVYNGRKNSALFRGAGPNEGISFVVNGERIPATLEHAEHYKKGIAVQKNGARVRLVEHLLSAVYAHGIDNVRIELSDDTCPTTDNCGREYFTALKSVVTWQNEPRRVLRYAWQSPVHYKSSTGPDAITIGPGKGFTIDYHASYPHPPLRDQRHHFTVSADDYDAEIADARAPAFLGHKLGVRAALAFSGRLHGVNERNYLLIGSKTDPKAHNPAPYGVRYEGKEFVRHKILDVLGTLALIGHRFKDTAFMFQQTGHAYDLSRLKQAMNDGAFTLEK